MTEAELGKLEQYERAATPGPWIAFTSCRDCDEIHLSRAACPGEVTDADLDLIRTSRDALPKLIAEVRRLRAKVGELEGEVVSYMDRVQFQIERMTALERKGAAAERVAEAVDLQDRETDNLDELVRAALEAWRKQR